MGLPAFLQFKTATPFFVCLCLFTTVQSGYITAILPGVLTTLEKRYGLSTTSAALLITTYSVLKMLLAIPLTNFGSSNIPRHMGFCVMVCGVGCILFGMVNFIDGSEYTPKGSTAEGTCPQASTSCATVGMQELPFALLVIAQIISGAGCASYYNLGPLYIDGNVPRKSVPIYYGIFYACVAFGPLLGYMFAGALLASPVEVGADWPGIDSNNPNWVGNWWLPFLVVGIFMFMLAPFFFLCPVNVPGVGESEMTAAASRPSPREVWKAGKSIVCNKVWLFCSLATASEGFIVAGYSGLGPKLMEALFSMSSANASFVAGAAIVPSAVLGMLLGGCWDSKRHKKLRDTSAYNWRIGIIALVFIAIATFIQCDDGSLVGLNDDAGNGEPMTGFLSACNNGSPTVCDCTPDYQPYCGVDAQGREHTFFNPCFAGCATKDPLTGQDAQTYSDCACVGAPEQVVKVGACSSLACGSIIPFVLILFSILFFTFMNNAPGVLMLMQCLPFEQRAIGLAINDIVNKLLGSIQAPIVFGFVFDSNCIQYSYNACGDKDGCALYDNTTLSILFFAVLGGLGKGLSILCFYIAFRYVRGTPLGERSKLDIEQDSTSRRTIELNLDVGGKASSQSGNGKEEEVLTADTPSSQTGMQLPGSTAEISPAEEAKRL